MSQAERVVPSFEPAVARPAFRLVDLSESNRWAYYLLLPSLLLVAAVAIYPVTSGVWLSFQRYNLLRAPVPSFIGLNLDGALLATQRAGRMMQAQDPHPSTGCRGKILNISSGAAERGRPFLPAYGASKAALNHLAKSTALVLGPHAIATTVLYPTSVREGMFGPIADQMAEFEGMSPDEFAAQRAAGSPLERLQKAEEVSAIAVWVAAHQGMSLNGQLVHTEAHVGSLP